MKKDSEKTIIHVEDLTVAYQYKPVLWDIDLDLPEAKLIAIVGPNGAGKSTLMKAMLGLLKPISGRTLFWGKEHASILQKVSYIPQKSAVDWDFPTTVLDVVTMGRYASIGWIRRVGKKDKKIAMEALEKVGISDLKDRQISRLSGGQQQRVFLARALAQEADIYFMDEPFQGVDMKTEQAIVQLLKELRNNGKTVVVIHHDLQTVPEYFDWVTLLNRVVVANGPTAEVFTEENIHTAYLANAFSKEERE